MEEDEELGIYDYDQDGKAEIGGGYDQHGYDCDGYDELGFDEYGYDEDMNGAYD